MVLLAVVFGLAVYATFFAEVGPISKMLGTVFFIGFWIAMVWLQHLWLPRVLTDLTAWSRGGPPTRPLDTTLSALDEARKKKRQRSASQEEGPVVGDFEP
jgi:hypothetical protein